MTKQPILDNLVEHARTIIRLDTRFPGLLPKTTVKMLRRGISDDPHPGRTRAMRITQLQEAIRLAKLHEAKFEAAVADSTEEYLSALPVQPETDVEIMTDFRKKLMADIADDTVLVTEVAEFVAMCDGLHHQLKNLLGGVRHRDQAKFQLFLAELAVWKSTGSGIDLAVWKHRAEQKLAKYQPIAA